jgi:uncharacterized OsmC-like protein
MSHTLEVHMRISPLRTLFFALIAALTLTIGSFAAAKQYQFTGTVKSVEGDTFTVEKTATEIWSFSTDSSTKGKPKVGDKVTVHYRMIATAIESKGTSTK